MENRIGLIAGQFGPADDIAFRVDPVGVAVVVSERAQIDHAATAQRNGMRSCGRYELHAPGWPERV